MARATRKTSTSARKSGTRKPAARKTGTLTAGAAKVSGAEPAAAEPQSRTAPEPKAVSAAEAQAAPPTVVVAAAAPVVSAPELAKKELIEKAVERSGVKKKDAKPVVEAVLALLGEAVAEGRELNLKPFGKLRINRSQERSNGTVFVCKLRQPLAASEPQTATPEENAGGGENSSNDPLAEPAVEG
ncbi:MULTISPECIES: HU family DNA-binding protein [unclassified Leisingera]|uniref:HU family DNA-binding protein n=1 Tax=unclassified Leisingera TaxID=2614906 RepID=UPI0002D7DE4C|nr:MULTISPECIES: HU family DNA-binding protein [unclassified Leisingera]